MGTARWRIHPYELRRPYPTGGGAACLTQPLCTSWICLVTALQDLHKPDANRLRRNLSGIINFAKFREEKLAPYTDMQEAAEHLLEETAQLEEQQLQLVGSWLHLLLDSVLLAELRLQCTKLRVPARFACRQHLRKQAAWHKLDGKGSLLQCCWQAVGLQPGTPWQRCASHLASVPGRIAVCACSKQSCNDCARSGRHSSRWGSALPACAACVSCCTP